MAKDCPNKAKQAIKAIEDGPLAAITPGLLNGFFSVRHDGDDGFRAVRRHGRKPMPTKTTLHSFLSKNNFEALGDVATTTTRDPGESPTSTTTTRTTNDNGSSRARRTVAELKKQTADDKPSLASVNRGAKSMMQDSIKEPEKVIESINMLEYTETEDGAH